ncbi:MAG: T9SS type A sorting domain-containing protein [Sporocytophaga sp.]|uniref:T9SS type A sorting domain-containing protein n=1 Tax=Sporocytophaga sp. TaxID=2231183 RepID=UPI001B26E2F3|nr:T9SS type A sorting domain-containing protein [Sporocytophaga sp.]MBO9699988.1 T9SS type A sorting domain-containing protein [Sporocytophaga sp.]
MKFFFTIGIFSIVTFQNFLYGQTFRPFPNNPVISFKQPNPGVWNDPCVLKVNNEYWMYLTSPNGKTGPFDGNVLPYLMESPDGVIWTLNDSVPLLLNNTDQEAWDSKGVETPSVIYFNSLYHMYYTAVPENGQTGQAAIGHATSGDGRLWTKDKIILEPSGVAADWKSYSVAEPGAVVYNGMIYLYFTGVGARQDTTYPAGQSVIGLCISEDGFLFGPAKKVLTQGGLFPASESYYGYSTPAALIIDEAVHLYYDVVLENPQWHQTALHHAYSTNGIDSFIEDPLDIFEKSDFTWTSREIRSPSVLLDSSVIKMWFAGDDIFNSGKFGIGYASSNVPVTGIGMLHGLKKASHTICPNPTVNLAIIVASVNFNLASFQLYDNFGRLVREEKNISGQLFVLQRDHLPSGIYLIRVVEEGNAIIQDRIIFRDE